MPELTLTTWPDAALAHLLTQRPDLASPLPGSLTALASRAATTRSTQLALTRLDLPHLAVLDTVVALSSTGRGASEDAVADAVGVPAERLLADLAALALLVTADGEWHPGEGVAEARGPGAASPAVGHPGAGGATPVALRPPIAPGTPLPTETVTAEAARAALEVVRTLGELAALWAGQPAAALRSGGIGVREVRRTAQRLGLSPEDAMVLVELAMAAGVVGRLVTAEETVWAPVAGALEEPGVPGVDAARRWADAVLAWWESDRVIGLAGTTAADGTRHAPLDPGAERGWARPLRERVLRALAAWPRDEVPGSAALLEHLAWATPAAPPPAWAVTAVLREAGMLGLTGAGALAATGRALLTDGDDGVGDPGDGVGDPDDEVADRKDGGTGAGSVRTGSARIEALAGALAEVLPPAVEEMLVQADLTAVVPGRPSDALAALLASTAEVESRGGALTARFTPASLSRAIEAGASAPELLAALAGHSRTPLPQALEYAVRDAARSHSQLRVGAAGSYLRGEDPVALATLVHDTRFGLRLLAPTVAVSPLPANRLADLLRSRGVSLLLEAADGTVLRLTERTEAPHPVSVGSRGTPVGVDVAEAVRRLRRGEERALALAQERRGGAGAGDASGASGPATRTLAGDGAAALAALRTAARRGTVVRLVVAGPSGSVDARRVSVLSVRDGVLHARDLDRSADLTVAAHRILAVDPLP